MPKRDRKCAKSWICPGLTAEVGRAARGSVWAALVAISEDASNMKERRVLGELALAVAGVNARVSAVQPKSTPTSADDRGTTKVPIYMRVEAQELRVTRCDVNASSAKVPFVWGWRWGEVRCSASSSVVHEHVTKSGLGSSHRVLSRSRVCLVDGSVQ